MDTGGLALFDCAPGGLYLIGFEPRKRADLDIAQFCRQELDRLEVARRSTREARFEDVYTQAFQLLAEVEFLFYCQRSARCLLTVTQRRIENLYRSHAE